MTAVYWLNLFASSAGFASGSYYLKRYADFGTYSDLGCAFAIFAISNLIYAQVLAKGLGQGAALSSMSHLIIVSMIGMIAFGERMNIHQVSALMFALASIWLFAQSSHQAAV